MVGSPARPLVRDFSLQHTFPWNVVVAIYWTVHPSPVLPKTRVFEILARLANRELIRILASIGDGNLNQALAGDDRSQFWDIDFEAFTRTLFPLYFPHYDERVPDREDPKWHIVQEAFGLNGQYPARLPDERVPRDMSGAELLKPELRPWILKIEHWQRNRLKRQQEMVGAPTS